MHRTTRRVLVGAVTLASLLCVVLVKSSFDASPGQDAGGAATTMAPTATATAALTTMQASVAATAASTVPPGPPGPPGPHAAESEANQEGARQLDCDSNLWQAPTHSLVFEPNSENGDNQNVGGKRGIMCVAAMWIRDNFPNLTAALSAPLDVKDRGVQGVFRSRTVAVDEYRLGYPFPLAFRWAHAKHYMYTPHHDASPGDHTKEMDKEISRHRANRWKRREFTFSRTGKYDSMRWAHFIRPGSNVIDIGANVGDTTVEMALFAGPEYPSLHAARRAYEGATPKLYGGHVVAIEANPLIASHLVANVVVNSNINKDTIFNDALLEHAASDPRHAYAGNRNRSVRLFVDKIHAHVLAIAEDHGGEMILNVDCGGCNSGPQESAEWSGAATRSVPTVRFDKFFLEQKDTAEASHGQLLYGAEWLRNVSFIKIDAEGYDKTILSSMNDILNNGKIWPRKPIDKRPIMWCEWFNPYWENQGRGSVKSKLLFEAIAKIDYTAIDYRSVQPSRAGQRIKVSALTRLTPDSPGQADLLLLPNGMEWLTSRPTAKM